MAPRSSHVLVPLLLSAYGYACGEAPTKPPVVAATVGAAPTAASGPATPRALRRRVCKLGLTRREASRDVSGESELTIGEDAAGDAVELRLAARDHELTLERSYDSVHRFLSERRRMRSPNEDWRTTFTWQRDAKGQVVQAERAEENLGPQGTRRPLHVISVVLERNAKGGWLRRESRDPDVVFRRAPSAFRSDVFWLEARFGKVRVPWGDVHRLRRSSVDLALGGGPDVVNGVNARTVEDRLVGRQGDSLVVVAELPSDPSDAIRSTSIHQYGASSRPWSPHHADQAPLFVRRELKPTWRTPTELAAHTERSYHPGEAGGAGVR